MAAGLRRRPTTIKKSDLEMTSWMSLLKDMVVVSSHLGQVKGTQLGGSGTRPPGESAARTFTVVGNLTINALRFSIDPTGGTVTPPVIPDDPGGL